VIYVLGFEKIGAEGEAKGSDIESNGAHWEWLTLRMADPNPKLTLDVKYGQVNPGQGNLGHVNTGQLNPQTSEPPDK